MASKEIKKWAFNTALGIVTKYAEGGTCAQRLDVALEDLYKKLIQIQEEVEKAE
jgi:hypothetical protein